MGWGDYIHPWEESGIRRTVGTLVIRKKVGGYFSSFGLVFNHLDSLRLSSFDLYLYLCTLAIYFRNWGLGFIYFLPCATRLVISICNNKWHVSSWSSSGIRWKPKRKKERCDNLQAITQIYSIWGESEIVGNVFKWRTGHQMCLLILCSPPFSFHDYLTLLSSILAMMYTIVCGRGQLSIPCWI